MRFRLMTLLLLLPALLFLAGCGKDEDDTPAAQHNITLTSPNGGESWATGSTHDITWTDNGVTNTKVLFSADNGTNWTVIMASTATNSYSWTTPTEALTTYKVKVVDAADSTVSDVSDAAFTLTDADEASHAYTSTTGGTFETPGGARMTVPVGAVPMGAAGAEGEMVFSIESSDMVVTAPTGETLSGDVYQFGPEGFTLARPVEIALPIPGTGDPGEVKIWRRNPTTGVAEYFGSNYDSTTRTVRAQAYQFSPWFATTSGVSADAAGALRVSNGTGHWLSLCVTSYTLEYPAQVDWLPEIGQSVIYAPQGEIGWASTGNWYLPQGTYTFCLDYENNSQYWHEERAGIVIGSPWSHSDPQVTDFAVGTFLNALEGRCDCVPLPDSAVGTGDIQVTLVWHLVEPGLDLDLWVEDPTGEQCGFSNGQYPDVTTTGGQLDRDNLCGSYTNGRPENIYWTTTPPAGEYIVMVDWWGDCGAAGATQDFAVRTVVQGVTRNYTATIPANADMQEVCRFTVVGSTVQFHPAQNENLKFHTTPRGPKPARATR